MMRAAIPVALALLLGGCSDTMIDSFTFFKRTEKPVRRDQFPADFKDQIIRVLPSVVADRSGIREAFYSDPIQDPNADTYASCVRFNARDGGGQYLGSKEYVVYYYNGEINQFVPAEAGQCRAAGYKPFPELERLCPGGKC